MQKDYATKVEQLHKLYSYPKEDEKTV